MTEPEILVERDGGRFHLRNAWMSYVIELQGDRLLHRHWGPRLERYEGTAVESLASRGFAAVVDDEADSPSYPEAELSELSLPYEGDFRQPSLVVRRPDGYWASRLRYCGYEVVGELLAPEGLPHIRRRDDAAAKTLTLRFEDAVSGLSVRLHCAILEEGPVVIRWMEVANEGGGPLLIERALSAQIDLPYDDRMLLTLHGAHLREFQIERSVIAHGTFSVSSSRGASSPHHHPFAAFCEPAATETAGEVRAVELVYSGNHIVSVERDHYDHLRLGIGINPEGFVWELGPGDTFTTPEAVLVYGNRGLNGMSRTFHELWNGRLTPPLWAHRLRPILLNTWEMCYFDVSEERLLQVIDEAADLGFELVVLDDGWFGERDDSRSSLGDWTVNPRKFPRGLAPLIDAARERGMGFGIWLEPEMVSPRSDLFRIHPDWAVRIPGYEPRLSRHQLVLDLTRDDVRNHVIGKLTDLLEANPVSYVKWDMNRHITDPGSPTISSTRTGEFSHRYILGLYRILDELTRRFPEVLFENCSSGGGRFDPGMAFYMPQTWTSDNTDAVSRQRIQYGASLLFPPVMMTSHVSTCPNHQTGRNVPFATRAAVASSANMGYELDILDLSPEERELVRAHIERYRDDRDLVQGGEFFRLESPFDGDTCAWMLTDPARTRAIVHWFTVIGNPVRQGYRLRIPYLDSRKAYVEAGSGRRYGGDELAGSGIAFVPPKTDYPSVRLEFRAL